MYVAVSLDTYYTNYKNTSRMIWVSFGFWLWMFLCPFFESMDKVRVCVGMCVSVCVCVCVYVCSLLSLSPSARPLCRHTLQRAPSCHSWRHAAPKNVTIRGRGETKREKCTLWKWWVVWVWSPTSHPLNRWGFVISSVIARPFLQQHPHTRTHTHTHTHCALGPIWCTP